MATDKENGLMDIRIPAGWTLAGLIGGLLFGMALHGTPGFAVVEMIAAPIGSIWLDALQMTIIPLVASLLVLGISQMAQAASAGRVARHTVGWIFGLLVLGAISTCIFMPLLLEAFPIPEGAAGFLMTGEPAAPSEVPGVGAFVTSLVAPNIIAAAAQTSMLPLTIFFALLALAIVRLPTGQRDTLLALFRALGNAMLVIIGWVLAVAPVGVFALAIGVAANGGGGAFATLAHYILTVAAMGTLVMLAGYVVAIVGGRIGPLAFTRAMLPAQAVALSTQSSLASLPAMLVSARRMGIRESTADFVLPLAVAIFRATSPAMNLAVAIYVAHLAGVTLDTTTLATGVLVALIISVGSVSLPGSISFVVSIGPIAIAMGIPVEPLALLVAVEMLPDIMRTIGNVTMDVAVTTAVDHEEDLGEEPLQP
ncbi:cation:dicarboxylate symporter family transporter [Erythrobacter sp.]|uniref:dicarboxylate/amino acid:cation symporter n=1 Tax=Erythrobacter sp. TaxID=1042 RepID=UPI0031203AA0